MLYNAPRKYLRLGGCHIEITAAVLKRGERLFNAVVDVIFKNAFVAVVFADSSSEKPKYFLKESRSGGPIKP